MAAAEGAVVMSLGVQIAVFLVSIVPRDGVNTSHKTKRIRRQEGGTITWVLQFWHQGLFYYIRSFKASFLPNNPYSAWRKILVGGRI